MNTIMMGRLVGIFSVLILAAIGINWIGEFLVHGGARESFVLAGKLFVGVCVGWFLAELHKRAD